MKGPKVAVIGAGSYFFGKAAIWNMINSEILREGTLALVDTDAKVLDVMMELAKKTIAAAGVNTKLIGSTDRKQVISDSDFVVLTFSFRNAYYRGLDTMISRKYGVTMCSSDTIGPGGIFRALREVPEILNVARDIKELCPDAWLINFINPSTVNGIALQRFAPEVKSFALCDGNHLPYAEGDFMKLAGLLPESFNHHKESIPADILKDFSYKLSGINHLTFIFECTFKGEDRMPYIKEYINRKALDEWQVPPSPKAKPRLHFNYIKQFLDVYNAYPTAVSHSKEYVPFFQGYGVSPATPEPIITFDAYNRDEEMKAAWAHTEKLANGEIPIEEFLKNGCGDHATDIIESMWGNLGKQFYINTLNRGTVPNMPADAVLEMKCDVDMNGPRPLPVGNMPRGLFGLQMQVLDTHELTAEAAVTCDREILLRAMCTDPIINNIGDARNIMNELLELEREHLPEAWYK